MFIAPLSIRLTCYCPIRQPNLVGRTKIILPEWELRQLYVEDHRSQRYIAAYYGCSQETISARMRELGIPADNERGGWTQSAESNAKRRVAHMKMWDERGRVTTEHVLHLQRGEWKARAKECYARDNWTCQSCQVHCTTQGKTRIQAHHIVSRINGGNDDLDNLKTLCASCHRREECAT